jgi:lipoprotein-releasing system permease protein
MNRALIWQLAFRYLRGKRSANVVPILSRISMVAIAVSSAAMIVVFSVFNGLEGFVKELYTGFYPDIRVTAVRGKFFSADSARLELVRQTAGVYTLTTVIEDNAMVNNPYTGQQKVVWLKGIDKNYLKVNNITESIIGEDSVSTGKPYTVIGGARIFNELSADITNIFSTIELYYANTENKNFVVNPEDAYRKLEVHPAGIFHVSDDFDDKYILAPLSLVQTLLNEEGKYSSVEVKIAPGAAEQVKSSLRKIFGDGYLVETRFEQNKTMFMVMRGEKWAIYAILSLVLLIASFNMIGALSMLVLEKQKDIAILKAMGALPGDIRAVFILEGILWALMGGLAGILLGYGICLIQQRYGIITVGGSFLMDAFPVDMQLGDLLLVLATISAVGLLAAWYPAVRATRVPVPSLKGA